MPKGILVVESMPVSADVADDYHEWYAVHLREACDTEGIVRARRFRPVDHDGPFVAVYDIDDDDVAAARARMRAASKDRTPTPPSLQGDPPPRQRLYLEIDACDGTPQR